MIECGVKSLGPRPKDQTMWPPGSTSITRLLNWSAIRIFPGRLKPCGVRASSAQTAIVAAVKIVKERTVMVASSPRKVRRAHDSIGKSVLGSFVVEWFIKGLIYRFRSDVEVAPGVN